jgi:asparagine synthase (glutamine-hydrolysing)
MKAVLHVEAGVGLGHRRLSIIDLSTGQQPLYNEDQSVCVVFNGEIYNYQELIPELLALGHVSIPVAIPRSSCTPGKPGARIAFAVFAACLPLPSGIATAKRCFLARDRLAVKPLYYALLPMGSFSLARTQVPAGPWWAGPRH